MVPNNYNEFMDILINLVKNNYIHMGRIDDAVRRILRVKIIMGLFENPMADYSLVHELGSQVMATFAKLHVMVPYVICCFIRVSFQIDISVLIFQAHRNLAREAVRKSLVLLKNGKEGDSTLLPLPKTASKILVAGTHAHNLGYQCGGWTISWQGFLENNDTRGKS